MLSEFRPHEVYNLAAQSFVQTSWSQPVLTGETTALGFHLCSFGLRSIRSSDISLSANVNLSGNLYAPLAQLNEGSNLTVNGALFVRRVSISGQLTIHQDTAIFRAGSGCPAGEPRSIRGVGWSGCNRVGREAA